MTFDIYFGFELLALFIAIIKSKSLLQSVYKYFLPFLVLIVLYETGSLYNKFAIGNNNTLATNVITTIEFAFYSFFIRNTLKNQSYKKIILISIYACLAYNLISLVFIQGLMTLNVSAIIMQTIVIILITGVYFWELMQVSFSNSLSIIKLPGFWLTTGVLFFYLGEFLFFASFGYMAYKRHYEYIMLYRMIADMANAVLYTCLIISFLCLKPTRKLSIS
ncbi:hypothetical protein [Mucilaginibacter psychrotolerans]|uniref:YhhN-like protein n=1 Tax=Mucilaginibacter psychrotolerans TaxID=1524096 RepID=A0A4Y8SND3_9SPHI|nr:hypothetical protein [Mucilaginibacter psychrotolerans]TFF40205.1 hypothetical protein E2R66_02850 [Mucilaginibacter psychrotolerans]